MDSQLQQATASTTLSSLLSLAEFSQHVQQLSPDDQLAFCQSIFHANTLVEQRSHQRVYQAWQYIEQHKLWIHVQKTRSEYLQDVDSRYCIAPIVESEGRKQKALLEIQAVWIDPLDACLGKRAPLNASRNLLEQLARFAKLCHDVPTAIELLEHRIASRLPRSRNTEHIIVKDVTGAIEAWRSQQKKEHSARRMENQTPGRADPVASKRKRPVGGKTRAQAPGKQKRLKRPQIPSSPPTSEAFESQSELSDYDSSMFESSDDEAGMEDDSYKQVLKQTLPYTIPNLRETLREALETFRQGVPSGTWGAYNVGQMYRILKRVKPATVFVSSMPQGIRHGLHTTSSRENADVLSFDNETAGKALADGPCDGKPILIRNSNDHRGLEAQQLLNAIDRYCMLDLDVQDPTTSTESMSCRRMSPADLTAKFRKVLNGTKTIGYANDQLPPYNCLSLPSMSSKEPQCLASCEALRLDHLLRIWNPSTKSTIDRPFWSTLAMHLSISLSHQDHDGKGSLSHDMFGYKVCIFWPRMTDADRSKFLKEGMFFAGRGARYLVIAPGDQFIETPCCAQDVHAVISIGYCGVSRCIGECINSGHPRCCGLVGVDGTHYRHARFTADSVISALNELKSDIISNQEPDPNFKLWLDQVEQLANCDESFLGGSEACARSQGGIYAHLL